MNPDITSDQWVVGEEGNVDRQWTIFYYPVGTQSD